MALLQCVASHPETRSQFLLAHVPLFLYPFLHTVSKTRPFEYLRLTSLGVIGALVKVVEKKTLKSGLFIYYLNKIIDWRTGSNNIPFDHGNYTTLSTYHGIWFRTQ